jgi:DNA replication and repair protein RecF
MLAERIVARGFRNFQELDLALPTAGAVFLGPNGHGKTNLLELLYYPVLFRSLRGSRDVDVTHHGESGFHLTMTLEDGRHPRTLSAGFRCLDKRKRLLLDGAEPARLGDAIGHWLAVAFLPTDLRLVQGAAAERRHYLDRVLSLADREYLRALSRYRAALAQRNAALRQHRPDMAAAFDQPLGANGAVLVRSRLLWTAAHAEPLTATCIALGEAADVTLRYRGDESLADPAHWPEALSRSASRDAALSATTVGPHRHDLELRIGGRLLRDIGSTGQQRTAAVALKLLERATLASSSGSEPVLLLDDVFAELDRGRQQRLAATLLAGGARQTFITAPREEELPEGFHLETLSVLEGQVGSRVMA